MNKRKKFWKGKNFWIKILRSYSGFFFWFSSIGEDEIFLLLLLLWLIQFFDWKCMKKILNFDFFFDCQEIRSFSFFLTLLLFRFFFRIDSFPAGYSISSYLSCMTCWYIVIHISTTIKYIFSLYYSSRDWL